MDSEKRAEALTFLRAHTTGVLATSDSDGQPHASIVFYVADEQFNLHFVTPFGSRKYKALKENPRVAFTVGTQDVPQTLQMEGIAEEIVVEKEKNLEAAKLIDVLTQYSKGYYAPLVKMDSAEIELFKIQPKWIRWADYSVMDKTGSANVWTEIPVA